MEKFKDLDLVLICGNYGAGKTHLAYQYFTSDQWNYVNRVRIRRFLYEMLHFGKQWESPFFEIKHEYIVQSIEKNIVHELLWKNEKVILDKTSITKRARQKYIALAQKLNKTVGIIFLNTPVHVCMERNKLLNESHKTGVPEKIISELHARQEIPDENEGAKQIKIIHEAYPQL